MVTRSQSALNAHDVELLPGSELPSVEKEATKQYFNQFKNKEFLLHHADGLHTFVTTNSYQREEESFKNHVQPVRVSKISKGANVITSHVLYKIKKLSMTTLF